jgi:hypothetical protein
VRVAACGSTHNNMCAVCTIVCISALGSVWQCARQCAALSGSAAVCGSAAACGLYRPPRRNVVGGARDVYLCCIEPMMGDWSKGSGAIFCWSDARMYSGFE